MKSTKDENNLTIKITRKDKIYLSIVLFTIIFVAVAIILIHRHYSLQNKNNINHEQQQTEISYTLPKTENILTKLNSIGGYYSSTFGIYLIENKLNNNTLILTNTDIDELENMSQNIITIIGNSTLSEECILNNDELYNAIEDLANYLSNHKK